MRRAGRELGPVSWQPADTVALRGVAAGCKMASGSDMTEDQR